MSKAEPHRDAVQAPSATAYFIGDATARANATLARSARWDPNHADEHGAVGISYESGVFDYLCLNGGERYRLQVFSGSVGFKESGSSTAQLLRDPISTPWALWSFVPQHPGRILFCLSRSNQLLSCHLPLAEPPLHHGGIRAAAATTGSRSKEAGAEAVAPIYLLHHFENLAMITALQVASDGNVAAVGFRDGSVAFVAMSGTEEARTSSAEEVPRCHVGVHGVPVTALALLAQRLGDAGICKALCASGGADQSILIFDLRDGTRLFSLLTPLAAPVSAMALHLVPSRVADSSPQAPSEPSVLLAAGASDGGVQLWTLRAGQEPELRACWTNTQRTPLLAFAFSYDSGFFISVSEGVTARNPVGGAAHPSGREAHGSSEAAATHEVEVRGFGEWELVAQHSLRQLPEPIVSADCRALVGTTTAPEASSVPKLLVCRSSGALQVSEIEPFGAQPMHWRCASGCCEGRASRIPPAATGCDSTNKHSIPTPPSTAIAEVDLSSEDQVFAAQPISLQVGCRRAGRLASLAEGPRQDAASHCGGNPNRQASTASEGSAANRDYCAAVHTRQQQGGFARDTATDKEAKPRRTPPVAFRHPEFTTAEKPPPEQPPQRRLSSPPPAPGLRFDAPQRVAALLQAASQQEEPHSRLGRPAVCSSALLERELLQADSDVTASGNTAERNALRSRAGKRGALTLNTPSGSANRYHGLTPLDAPTPLPHPPASRPIRRHDARWLASRSLEPVLREYYTDERQPQVLDTMVNHSLAASAQRGWSETRPFPPIPSLIQYALQPRGGIHIPRLAHFRPIVSAAYS